MAYFRFRKSRSILPGVRVNLSKSGPSVSVGPTGAKLNVGPRGSRVTVGLPGSGLSLTQSISRTSVAKAGRKAKRSTKAVSAAMDGMTKDQQRELAAKCVMASSLADVKAQRDAFEAHLVDHAAEIEDGDLADIEQMRKVYAEAITLKEVQARRHVFLPLLLAALAGLAMWAGIAASSGWLIASSLGLLLSAASTEGGQRFLFGFIKLLLGLMGLFVAIAIIGAATLFILALTGNL